MLSQRSLLIPQEHSSQTLLLWKIKFNNLMDGVHLLVQLTDMILFIKLITHHPPSLLTYLEQLVSWCESFQQFLFLFLRFLVGNITKHFFLLLLKALRTIEWFKMVFILIKLIISFSLRKRFILQYAVRVTNVFCLNILLIIQSYITLTIRKRAVRIRSKWLKHVGSKHYFGKHGFVRLPEY